MGKVISYGFWCFDILAAVVSFLLALLVYSQCLQPGSDQLILFVSVLFSVTVYTLITKKKSVSLNIKNGAYGLIRYNSFIILCTLTILFFIGTIKYISRLFFGIYFLINAFISSVFHFSYSTFIKKYFAKNCHCKRLLVVTEHENIDDLAEYLHRNMPREYCIAGFATLGETLFNSNSGYLNPDIVKFPFDEVYIDSNSKIEEIQLLISRFREMGVPVYFNQKIPGGEFKRFAGNTCLLYEDKSVSLWQYAAKRLLDIAGGLIGSLITIILLPFISMAIKIDSDGPVFFSQKRIGKNGRVFKIYKFRSMYVDAEKRKSELMDKNEVNGLMFKMENDPRITKVGAFLRKTSLDEFPQFFNVLKGDMSLVGTRPPTVDEFDQYNEHYRKRLSMTPGLTGMWQVSGRSDIKDFDEIVRLDLSYIEDWSIKKDIVILFKTVGVLFTGKGAK